MTLCGDAVIIAAPTGQINRPGCESRTAEGLTIDIDELMRLIAGRPGQEPEPEALLQRFAAALRAGIGDCAIALLVEERRDGGRVQLTGFVPAGQDRPLLARARPFAVNGDAPLEDADVFAPLRAGPGAVVVPTVALRLPQQLRDFLQQQASASDTALLAPVYANGRSLDCCCALIADAASLAGMDREQAALVVNLAAQHVTHLQDRFELEHASQWIESELEEIGRIQQLLLPQQDLVINGVVMASSFRACRMAGGDYYDMVSLAPFVQDDIAPGAAEPWGVIIADVSGHGAGAAVEAAMFDAILRTYRGTLEDGPAAVFAYANRYFFTRRMRGNFITAFIANYDPRERRLLYAGAGHPSPLLRRAADGRVETLQESVGVPLGVDPAFAWWNASVAMEPGDLLVLYTDGVSEASDRAGRRVGAERLQAWVEEGPAVADGLLAFIEEELAMFCGDAAQEDDRTLLVIQPRGAGA